MTNQEFTATNDAHGTCRFVLQRILNISVAVVNDARVIVAPVTAATPQGGTMTSREYLLSVCVRVGLCLLTTLVVVAGDMTDLWWLEMGGLVGMAYTWFVLASWAWGERT